MMHQPPPAATKLGRHGQRVLSPPTHTVPHLTTSLLLPAVHRRGAHSHKSWVASGSRAEAVVVSTAVAQQHTNPRAAQQQYNIQQQPAYAGAAVGTVTVTWPGLLAALGLAATGLVAAAATCFFLYLKPVMRAMSVTLAEMEAAAKEMQQAAQEVEELVGGINSAIKQVMQPTSLLKWTTASTSSSTSPQSSMEEVPTASTSGNSDTTASSSTHRASSAAPVSAVSAAAGGSSAAAWQLTDQMLASLEPLVTRSLAALKLPGLDDQPSKQQQQQQQQGRLQRPNEGNSSSGSSSGMVWDLLASSLSTRATRRSLARLRSDLAAAANVLTVLLAPAPSRRLYEPVQQDEGQQQQQQQQEATEASPSFVAGAPPSINRLQTPGAPPACSRRRSSGAAAAPARRAVQVDEWGLPVTAAELADGATAAAQRASPQPGPKQRPTPQPQADLASASSSEQQQQWQQQQQHRGSYSSDDEGFHMDLSHYGRYLEQEAAAAAERTDSGITWQQLQQDASLMQRVFCDNQELALGQQWSPAQQQQQQQQQQEGPLEQGSLRQAGAAPDGHKPEQQ